MNQTRVRANARTQVTCYVTKNVLIKYAISDSRNIRHIIEFVHAFFQINHEERGRRKFIFVSTFVLEFKLTNVLRYLPPFRSFRHYTFFYIYNSRIHLHVTCYFSTFFFNILLAFYSLDSYSPLTW